MIIRTVILGLLLICPRLASTQEIAPRVYSNRFVGLDFSIPIHWYVATDDKTRELIRDAQTVVSLDHPAAQRITSNLPGKVLLIVSENPLPLESNPDVNR